jgi:hypothetical protein
MAYRKLSKRELLELAAAVAIRQFNERASGDGVYGVIDARDLAWVRRNTVKVTRKKDGSVRVDVIYSAAYQRELEEHAKQRKSQYGTATI